MSNTSKESASSSWTNRSVAWAMIAVALTLAVGVNLVVHRLSRALPLRADLTDQGVYSLDILSERVVSKAPEPILVRVFLSDDLPVPFHKTDQILADMLDEYVAASNGSLSYEFINPGDADDNEEAAKGHGCERVSIGRQSETEMSLRAVYKCVALVMGTKQVVIKDLALTGDPSKDNLELALTRAVLELQQTGARKIAFLSALGGAASSEEFATALEPIFNQYYSSKLIPVSLNLTTSSSIPQDIDVLMIVGVEEKLSEEALTAIDAFVQRGGNVGWLKSPIVVDIDRIQRELKAKEGQDDLVVPRYIKATEHTLAPLFEAWGVRLLPGLVLDRKHGMRGMVKTAQGDAIITHPANFQATDLDRSVSFLTQAPPLTLPAAGALRLTDQALASKQIQARAVIKTSPDATLRTDLPDTLGYESLVTPQAGAVQDTYTLGVTLEGVFPRAMEQTTASDAPRAARIVVISSDSFTQPNQDLGYGPELVPIGQRLFLDVIGWLAQDTALSRIRSKSRAPFVGEVDAKRKTQIQWINIVLVPFAFACIGAAMALRRRLRRRRIKESMSS